jgi:hypothetical protein
MPIDLKSELTFINAYKFPIQTDKSRQEILWGALLLLIPFIGWILNMGHRIEMVHKMQNGQPSWPAWGDYNKILKNGAITFLGMLYYYTPSFGMYTLGWYFEDEVLKLLAVLLFLFATVFIPGYMTHYCKNFDVHEIFNPIRTLLRVFQGGILYWKAWSITLSALIISFSGLLLFGIGFLITSVWFWQVAGYSFANVFTQKFHLDKDMSGLSGVKR